MSTWTEAELNKIGNAEELQISPRRRDDSFQKPRTIWVVRVGDDLYVRSYRGESGDWYRGTRIQHEGRIHAGGVEKDVTLVDIDNNDINNQIDAAYKAKYGRYSQYVAPMVKPEVRATTMKLVPLE
ncbi:MAG: DUF2255 family protein [Anaerolineales bacterium]|jgi:hypothetical protein